MRLEFNACMHGYSVSQLESQKPVCEQFYGINDCNLINIVQVNSIICVCVCICSKFVTSSLLLFLKCCHVTPAKIWGQLYVHFMHLCYYWLCNSMYVNSILLCPIIF